MKARSTETRQSDKVPPRGAQLGRNATLFAVVAMWLFHPPLASAQKPVTPRVAERPVLDTPEPLPSVAPDPALTLTELEGMAFSNNPSLARAQALVEAARGNWVQVGLLPNPQVGYEGQQIGSGGRAEQDGVMVGQEFVRGGKLKLNRYVAQQDILAAQQQLSAQQLRVQTDVRIAFYQVLVAQRQIDKSTELFQLSNKALAAADSLFKGKEVGRGDVLQAKLETENAKILLKNSQNRHAAAWQRLGAVIGRRDLVPQALAGDVEADCGVFTFEDALQRLTTSSPEIAVAVTNIERARWAFQRASVEATPNVSVQGLVNVRDEGIGGRPDGSLSVSLPLPVWNRNQGRMVQARYEAAAAERALQQLELDLQERLAPVFERYSSARNQVEQYRKTILPTATETLDLMRQSYEAGEIGFINLLTVQRTFSQTNLNYLEALRELRTAEAEIEGLLLSGSLQARP